MVSAECIRVILACLFDSSAAEQEQEQECPEVSICRSTFAWPKLHAVTAYCDGISSRRMMIVSSCSMHCPACARSYVQQMEQSAKAAAARRGVKLDIAGQDAAANREKKVQFRPSFTLSVLHLLHPQNV